MKRKGQAAMEFLMTYGWAILAAIIVIGVLAVYLTDLPGSGGSTYLNSPLYLVASNADASDDAVNLEIRNDGADTVDIQEISVDFGDFTCNTLVSTANVSVGSSTAYQVDCPANSVTEGDSYSGDITVGYYIGDGSVLQSTPGQISTAAIA